MEPDFHGWGKLPCDRHPLRPVTVVHFLTPMKLPFMLYGTCMDVNVDVFATHNVSHFQVHDL